LTDFADKTVLVTGGTRGIGFALAQALGAKGARVAIVGTDVQRAKQAQSELIQAGVSARSFILDVRDKEGWERLRSEVNSEFGAVDGLFLNAGGQGSRRNTENIADSEWRWAFEVNVHGVYNGICTFLPEMRRRGTEGHIVITSSIAAMIPRANVSAYGASKAAVLALAETLRLELYESPIRVSVLCPALVQTSFRTTNQRHAPGADEHTFDYMQAPPDAGLSASDYAERVLKALDKNEFYVFTHDEVREVAIQAIDVRRAALAAVYHS